MFKAVRQRSKEDGGFTLIELLVVIVIIGILAGVVVFAVSGIADRGEDSAEEADRRAVATAEEAFYAENEEYATECELVSEGFLQATSDLHDVTGISASGYTVTPNTAADTCP